MARRLTPLLSRFLYLQYGTQQPIALLHFLVGRGHMYDRSGKDLDLRTYKDLGFIGAMGPPGGGRNSVDPRFVALFSVRACLCGITSSGCIFSHFCSSACFRRSLT
jgi:hypothetical protein